MNIHGRSNSGKTLTNTNGKETNSYNPDRLSVGSTKSLTPYNNGTNPSTNTNTSNHKLNNNFLLDREFVRNYFDVHNIYNTR